MRSFEDINQKLIHPFKGVDDPKLIKNLKIISENFTQKRNQISTYVDSDEFVSSYTAFYFPTNMVKLELLFNRLDQGFVKSLNDFDVIDVGAGPGTYAYAFLDYFKEHTGFINLLESSERMVKQAKKIFETQTQITFNAPKFSSKKRLMIFGNSLNEMGVMKGLEFIDKYNPDVILLLEPGTVQSFQNVLELRNLLVRQNFNIMYPCVKQSNCPIDGQNDWCHQIFHHVHDPTIEQLSQIIHKDRRVMPVCSHVYAKEKSIKKSKEKFNDKKVVIFRVFDETKFSFNFEVCDGDKIFKIEVMKKDYGKVDQKRIVLMKAGEFINFEIVKVMGEVTRCVLIIENS